ncbi:PREDICTED: HORMA domain-containing protein 1-like isoform X2 [Priapulus caudatus]|uniref:HORMA domain-containing protein 1-like isoform X2 n=1 Tax=Priapulus caudatus TaxID=37621 RepID=A0ABM1END6_PRICU|nr:PREDICTED: HORMA domain-containing protein 1-like isoform X2 [Priapulus caudatus]
MSGVAQLARGPKTGTWGEIFPTEQAVEQQSLLFMKKLVAMAISHVAYLRAIFPENAFSDRCLEDLSLKILRDDSSCPGACQVIRWLKGVFDALERKYLRMLILGIYVDPTQPEKLIESYTFKFSYHADSSGVTIFRNSQKMAAAKSAAETRKATMILLRTLVVLTQGLGCLPDDVMMTMKLLYYDEVTPPAYEPPGFRPSDTDSYMYEDEPVNIKAGDVATKFHKLKVRIKVSKKNFGEDGVDETDANVHPVTNEGLDNSDDDLSDQMDVAAEKVLSSNSSSQEEGQTRFASTTAKEPAVPDPISPTRPSGTR